jgi:hypothetical protein
MALTRKLVEIQVNILDATGTTSTQVTALVTDDSEGTATGAVKIINAATVVNAANALRDAIVQVAANAGKPITF